MCFCIFTDRFILFLSAFILLLFGNLVIGYIIPQLHNEHVIKNYPKAHHPYLSDLLGLVESLAYALSWWFHQYQFIGIWLGVKAIGRWTSGGPPSIVDCFEPKLDCFDETNRKKAELIIYHLGSLLSVLLGALVGQILSSVIPINKN